MIAEINKADKIAAAKQKLKQFQNKRDQNKVKSEKELSTNVSDDNADTASISSSIIPTDNDNCDETYYQKTISNLEDSLQESEVTISTLECSNMRLLNDYENLKIYQSSTEAKFNQKLEDLNQKVDFMKIENNKLEIAEITLNENQKLQQQVEELLNEKLKLEHQLTYLENQKNDQEADLLNQIQSYQEYAKQIEDQFRDSSIANQGLNEVNEAFLQRERNLTRHINELQTQLEDLIKKKQFSCTNCAELAKENADLKLSIEEIRNGSKSDIAIQQTDDREEIWTRVHAMDKLEEKFKKMMEDYVNLTEEKQRLEHLVQQLQCETDTIGEYITLYGEQKVKLDGKVEYYNRLLNQFQTVKHDLGQVICNLREFLSAHRYIFGDKVDFNDAEFMCSKLDEIFKNFCNVPVPVTVSGLELNPGPGRHIDSESGCNICDSKSNEKCYACSGQMFTV